MVGLLLEVGLGSANEDDIRAALADPIRARKGAAAPAKGLCLRHVAIGRRSGDRRRTDIGVTEER